MTMREIDENTGEILRDDPPANISTGEDRKSPEDIEAAIRAKVEAAVRAEMAAAMAAKAATAPPQEPAPVQQAASAPEPAAQPLSQQAAVRGRGRPRKVVQGAPAVQQAAPPATRQNGGAVATAGQANLTALFAKHANKGIDFEAQDLAIPRLYLLQDMSPEVKDRSPKYVPGARPGMWYNTVTGELHTALEIVPIKFSRRYVGWRPRNADGSGGGLVRMDVPRAEWATLEEIGIGLRAYRDDDGLVEVVETPEWIALLLGDDGRAMPVAISFPKTKAKVSAKMNSLISMQTDFGPDGIEYTLPAFSNVIELSSVVEGEGPASYFVPRAEWLQRVDDLSLFDRAVRLFDQFNTGSVKVADLTEADQG